MANDLSPYNSAENNIVVYRTDDNTLQLDVQLAEETVWLSQQQMVALFDTAKSNISMHISNIYKEEELQREATVQDFLTVQNEGGRQVTRRVQYYNLDVIISVGYRVKSKRGTQFRQWALKILKEYLLKGHAINQQMLAIQRQIDSRFDMQDKRILAIENELHDHHEKIDFFVRTNQTPVEQVFFGGEFFAARVVLEKLIKAAKKRVIIIDRYIDATTFEMLDARQNGVTAAIYSEKDFHALRDAHNATAGVEPINTFVWSKPSHDRWLIIDDSLYHCGHSLKDMGRKLSAITLMGTPAQDIIDQVER